MKIEFYKIIGDTLEKGIERSYRKGLAAVVALNKKEILRLADTPEMFKINYTGIDKIALQNFKVEAFTVAGVMNYELEEKLKTLAADLQEGKHPLAQGESDIKKVWADEAQNILADYIPVADMPPPHYLNTNLRTAMQSSFHAAQYIRLQDESVRDLYPAYQYKTVADNRVRDSHMKLHDRIWRNDDPVWNTIYPPNGFNCRCYVKPLNVDEMNNSAVEPATSTDAQLNQIIKDGEIDKEFNRNPGQVKSIWGKWLDTKFKDVNYNKKFEEMFKHELKTNKPTAKKVSDVTIKDGHDKASEIKDVLNNANEVWGKTFKSNGITGTTTNVIRYDESGFTVVRIRNNEAFGIGRFDYSKIQDFRIGVLMP
jgi:SPP1 gp7 family putative phage head morphogenesis protein